MNRQRLLFNLCIVLLGLGEFPGDANDRMPVLLQHGPNRKLGGIYDEFGRFVELIISQHLAVHECLNEVVEGLLQIGGRSSTASPAMTSKESLARSAKLGTNLA